MKPRFTNRSAANSILHAASLIVVCLAAVPSSNAATDTWDGSTSTAWATGTNWTLDTTAPGTGEAATFNGAGNGNTSIDLGAGVTVGTILFDTAGAAAYTVGSGGVGAQTLTLNDTAAVTMNSTVANNQLFNANITLGTAVVGTTTITNATTGAGAKTLTFAGTITGGTGGTAGIKTILVTPASGASVNCTNAITAGNASGINLRNNSAGTVTLSGSVASSFNTLTATDGNGMLVVDGQTVNVASSSGFNSGNSTYGRFELKSGAANYNGGITWGNANSSGGMLKVSGGDFTAASVSFARTSGSDVDTATTAASTSTGLVVTGGTAIIAGTLNFNGSNSAATGLVDGGALTVGGRVTIANGSSGRWFRMQANSGSFTSTDTTDGIVLAAGTGSVQRASLLLTGGTTTAEKISFGLLTTNIGSTGQVTLNGASAALYLGGGGMVQSAGVGYTSIINLTNGTLGAKANWSTDLGITFSGSGTTIKAADVSDVSRNITLNGVLAGTGSFTKSGAGTLLLTNGANTFSGTATISAGILRSTHASALQNALVAATGMDIEDGLKIGTGITSPVIGGLSGSANFELLNEDSVPLALKLGNTNATYSGILTGSGSLEKVGSGTQTLSNANLHSGGTTISAGTLALSAGTVDSGHLAGSVTLANGGTLAFTNNNSTTDTLTFANALSVNSGATATINFGERSALNSNVTGDSTTTLKLVSGTIDRNDIGGNWTNFNGTLVFNDTNGTVRAMELSNNGGTFNTNGLLNATIDIQEANLRFTANGGGNTVKIGALSGSASGILGGNTTGGSVTWEIGNKNSNPDFAGVIADGNNATKLTKVGTGIQTLSGTNTYTGATIVTGGTLALAASGSIANSATVTIGAAGTLDTSAHPTHTIPGAQPVTFGINATGSGSSGKIAAADLDITNAVVTYSIAGTPDDPVYVLATYTSLAGTNFASVDAPPAGYTLSYTYQGNKIALVQLGSGPEIAVEQPVTTNINSGESKDFGTVTVGSNTSLTFTIRNTGADALNLTGTPRVAVSGTNAADFTVTAQPNTPVTSGGGTTTFTVQFAPGAAGARNAVLTIANNDSDEATFTINVSGTGQSQYDAWSGGAAFNVDTNGDGVKNGLAFLLGAANPNESALDKLPVVSQSGGDLTLIFQCLKSANRGDSSLSVEHSSDLGISDPWTSATVTDADSGPTSGVTFTVSSAGPTLNDVSATISVSEAASGKLFSRLRANQP